ncbi:MAG: cytochrome c biogenesis CcdA family protein [Candidatus Planktophila sp.]
MTSFVVDQLMGGTLIAALPIALLAGLLSFLSPCVLPLVPGYIAYATGFSSTKGKVLLGSLLFVLGFTFIFASYGLAFGGLGSQISTHEDLITFVLGVITIVMGAIFLGLFPFAPTFSPRISTTGGIAGAPLLGAAFGIGWTPCIGPALATVQTLAFNESSAMRGAILSIGYSIGLGIPFILSGLFLDRSKKVRAFFLHRGSLISKVGGVLLILIGLLQVTGLWGDVMINLRSLISDFVPVI